MVGTLWKIRFVQLQFIIIKIDRIPIGVALDFNKTWFCCRSLSLINTGPVISFIINSYTHILLDFIHFFCSDAHDTHTSLLNVHFNYQWKINILRYIITDLSIHYILCVCVCVFVPNASRAISKYPWTACFVLKNYSLSCVCYTHNSM